MRRRNFVEKTGAGILGLGVLPPFMRTGALWKGDVHVWFQQLCRATGARHVNYAGSISIPLSEAVESLSTAFERRGYRYADSGYYFYGGEAKYCAYAFELQHPGLGISDLLIPVLYKKTDGGWSHFTTLNGFQVEALNRAAVALHAHTTPLDQMLLPAIKRSHVDRASDLHSEVAKIKIRTFIRPEAPVTQTVIETNGHVIFSEEFVSEHCLTCRSSFA